MALRTPQAEAGKSIGGKVDIVFPGINLATLLVASGRRVVSTSEAVTNENREINTLCAILLHHLGTQGPVGALSNYWECASLFELCVTLSHPSSLVLLCA
jgi:hypothetical protein